jgi:transporter family-2 protein
MGKFVPILAALAVGVAVAIQGPVNTELSRHIGQFRAILFSVTVTLIIVLTILLLGNTPGTFSKIVGAPPWALIGGTMGVISLAGIIIAVPRVGVAAATGAVVAGQVMASAIIDQFGLLGVAVRPLTPGRLAGLALVALAVALVTRG